MVFLRTFVSLFSKEWQLWTSSKVPPILWKSFEGKLKIFLCDVIHVVENWNRYLDAYNLYQKNVYVKNALKIKKNSLNVFTVETTIQSKPINLCKGQGCSAKKKDFCIRTLP